MILFQDTCNNLQKSKLVTRRLVIISPRPNQFFCDFFLITTSTYLSRNIEIDQKYRDSFSSRKDGLVDYIKTRDRSGFFRMYCSNSLFWAKKQSLYSWSDPKSSIGVYVCWLEFGRGRYDSNDNDTMNVIES